MGIKNTIKLVKKVLKDETKHSLYSPEELLYMQRQLGYMKEERKKRKLQKKQQQGFGYVERETDQSHNGSRGT